MSPYIAALLSLLASGALLAQSQQQIRDQVFGDTDAVKQQAEDLNARVLAPESHARGMKVYLSAVGRMEQGKSLDSIRIDLAEARRFFEAAVEASQLARTTFRRTLAARAAAGGSEAAKYVAREWERAEAALIYAAATLEGGNLDKATKQSADAEKLYRGAEARAIEAKARAPQ